MKLPQLTLRDLFWLVLVCGLAVGWWLSNSRLHRESSLWQFRAETVKEFVSRRFAPTSVHTGIVMEWDATGCVIHDGTETGLYTEPSIMEELVRKLKAGEQLP